MTSSDWRKRYDQTNTINFLGFLPAVPFESSLLFQLLVPMFHLVFEMCYCHQNGFCDNIDNIWVWDFHIIAFHFCLHFTSQCFWNWGYCLWYLSHYFLIYADFLCPYFALTDLKTMTERLKNRYYVTKKLFIADLQRIITNCREYNPPDSEYCKCANTLEKFFYFKLKDGGLIEKWSLPQNYFDWQGVTFTAAKRQDREDF